MNTQEQEVVKYIAHRLLAGRYDIYGRELVALIGTGRETDNLAATAVWIEARAEEGSLYRPQEVGELREAFDDCLIRLKDRLHQNCVEEVTVPASLKSNSLTDCECRCMVDALVYLMAGPLCGRYLYAAVALILENRIACESAIFQWVRNQEDRYVFYPAELTLQLAQRLQRELLTLEEV